MKGINPNNNKQARIFLDLNELYYSGIKGIPCEIMNRLAYEHGLKILDCVPQTLFDGIDFWIEFDTYPEGLPDIFRDVPWRPIGVA